MPKPIEKLSLQQAQKLVLLSQRLPPSKKAENAVKATQAAIEHLGYIQIDTISVIERAHHHTIWNRNPLYKAAHLDELLKEKKIFEYWSHAASYLPMRDYRYSLPRKLAIANGKQNHWYERNKKLMKLVHKRIATEGPLMAKDFEYKGKKLREWASKPAKQALEYLFMQGELMIPHRKNFHKVYDLTERVLTDEIDISVPTEEEHARFLITRYLETNGIGRINEMVYLLRNKKSLVLAILKEMLLAGEISQVKVKDTDYYTLPTSIKLLNKRLDRKTLKILSPFDNLLIQRERMKMLFDFDYKIECYVPKAKREYGYFCLPILWDGQLVARLDCKNDRKESVLHLFYLALESTLSKKDEFAMAFCKELKAFMLFNSCKIVKIHKTSPVHFAPILQEAINGMILV